MGTIHESRGGKMEAEGRQRGEFLRKRQQAPRISYMAYKAARAGSRAQAF